METEKLFISCVPSDIEKLLKFKRHRKRMENEQTDYICICLFFQKIKKLIVGQMTVCTTNRKFVFLSFSKKNLTIILYIYILSKLSC